MSKGCCGGTCKRRVTAKCPWRLYRIEEGKREYTGKRCDLEICDEHQTVVSGKPLCKWHGMKAGEMGLS